jgi:hypothetical protein
MSEHEEWRQIPGFPDYFVSDLGRVLSRRRRKPCILAGQVVEGYRRVMLFADKRVSRSVHSLVAEAFIGPRPDGLEIRHLNGDPLDCRIENLAYGTHVDNMRDRVQHGRHPMKSKTHCPQQHEYTPENTVVEAGNRRRCRACKNARQRDYQIRMALRAAGVAA